MRMNRFVSAEFDILRVQIFPDSCLVSNIRVCLRYSIHIQEGISRERGDKLRLNNLFLFLLDVGVIGHLEQSFSG
jgi:hypothetical protein